MISAYTDHGYSNKALKKFNEMQDWGILADEYTFTNVIVVVCKFGNSCRWHGNP
jgi:pentatricopeptide repeat protein